MSGLIWLSLKLITFPEAKTRSEKEKNTKMTYSRLFLKNPERTYSKRLTSNFFHQEHFFRCHLVRLPPSVPTKPATDVLCILGHIDLIIAELTDGHHFDNWRNHHARSENRLGRTTFYKFSPILKKISGIFDYAKPIYFWIRCKCPQIYPRIHSDTKHLQ